MLESRRERLGGGVDAYEKYAKCFGMTLSLFLGNLIMGTSATAQSTYTAQLTGVVTDSSGGVIPGVKVTLTDEGTNVASTHDTDGRGTYVFTGIRPSTYTIRVDAPNMNPQERKGVILAVSQQATLDFTLAPRGCRRA